MLQVGSRAQSRVVEVEVTDGRWVSLDIGPFADQGDLLRFSMLLEQMPGVGQLDLLDADPETALFAVRFRSAAEFSSLLSHLPDYRIRATTLANMVSAQIVPERGLAGVLLLPGAASGVPGARAGWWARLAGATAAGAAAVGVLYLALTGNSTDTPVPAAAVRTPTPVASAAAVAPMSPLITTPVAASPPAASTPVPTPAAPAATAPPAATPATPTATPLATPTPSPTPVPARTAARYAGAFTTSLGVVRATNGCQWDVRIDGNLEVSLTSRDGALSGPASMDGSIVYVVRDTPPGATCNPATAAVEASGSASGGDTIEASLTGARDLVVRFTGALQGSDLTGDLRLDRTITTVSSFGNTSEVRTGSASGITLSRID